MMFAMACALFAAGPGLRAQVVQVLETRADQSVLLAHSHASFAGGEVPSTKVTLTVDPSLRLQTMDGFGASLTQSSASLLMKLPPAQRSHLMHDFFAPDGPAGLTLLRQPIGASDFSTHGDYSYDDPPKDAADPSLLHFSVAPDQHDVFPLLREALHLNPQLRLMVLPWSAPAWMKSSHTMKAGSLADEFLAPYAHYLARTVESYASEGLPVFTMSLQNEPLNENATYPTQLMKPDQEARLAAALAPLLRDAGRSPLLFGYEHNWNNLDYANELLAESARLAAKEAPPLFAGISFHCYGGNESAQLTLLRQHPEIGVWFTECSGTNRTSFADDLLWQSHHLLLGAPLNGARSVMLWNLVLDPHGGPHNGGCNDCRALVTVELHPGSDATLHRNVEFYVLAHAAPFIHPGATQVALRSSGDAGLLASAFENPDGTYAVLVLNESPSATNIRLQWYGRALPYAVPPRALLTFTWGEPKQVLVEGTYRLAVNASGAASLEASAGSGVLKIAAASSSPNQLWTLRRLASGKFEIRNLATAQALALTPRGALTTLALDGAHIAPIAVREHGGAICLLSSATESCNANADHRAPSASQLLYLVAPAGMVASDKDY